MKLFKETSIFPAVLDSWGKGMSLKAYFGYEKNAREDAPKIILDVFFPFCYLK